jgi:maleate isomerase
VGEEIVGVQLAPPVVGEGSESTRVFLGGLPNAGAPRSSELANLFHRKIDIAKSTRYRWANIGGSISFSFFIFLFPRYSSLAWHFPSLSINMAKRIRLGILTPSSNTALEPLTQALINSLNAILPSHNITVHFSRFPVKTISLTPSGLAQFDLEPILSAAQLLAHAEVDVIGWSGTSAGWLGFDRDVKLCQEIEKATGIKAMTSVLALNQALKLWNVKKLGLVTPYRDDVQKEIVKNYKSIGIEIGEGMERHLRVEKINDIADIEEEVLDGMVGEVVKSGIDAVTTFCTNLVAAQRVEYWEKEHGVPVFDTITTILWGMLRECGVDATMLQGWGTIFQKG